MKLCPHCGKENPDEVDVCQQCGERLTTKGQPPRLLSQIQGLIPAEPVITTGRLRHPDHVLPETLLPEHLPASSPVEERPQAAQEASRAAPAAGAALPHRHSSASLPLIAGIFFAVILLGSLWNVMAPRKVVSQPSVENAYAFIEILPENANVLLAWDYDPTTQGELQLLAQPILQHLQRKGANMVFMSLRPFGPTIASDALKLSRQWLPPHMSGLSPAPVEFGFIPGENAALQSLALSPVIASNQPMMSAAATGLSPTQTIDAFDLIIEFSADLASSQQWVEQIAVRTQTPLIVAASGATAPLLRPYEQTRQIRVLLSGYPDALAYENLLGQKGPAHAQSTAQTLAIIALLALIFLAAFRSLFRK